MAVVLCGCLALWYPYLAGSLARNLGAVAHSHAQVRQPSDRVDLRTAIAYFESALAWNPADLRARWRLGQALELAGDADAALQHWRSVPTASGWLLREGQIASRRRDGVAARPDFALRRFQQAVALDPASAEAHYWLGRAYAGRKEWHLARVAFEQAVALDPTHLSARAEAARARASALQQP